MSNMPCKEHNCLSVGVLSLTLSFSLSIRPKTNTSTLSCHVIRGCILTDYDVMTSFMSNKKLPDFSHHLLIFLFALIYVYLCLRSFIQEPGGAGGESVAQSPAGGGKSKVMVSLSILLEVPTCAGKGCRFTLHCMFIYLFFSYLLLSSTHCPKMTSSNLPRSRLLACRR